MSSSLSPGNAVKSRLQKSISCEQVTTVYVLILVITVDESHKLFISIEQFKNTVNFFIFYLGGYLCGRKARETVIYK